jgi:nicotinate dehydrogenase subunit A
MPTSRTMNLVVNGQAQTVSVPDNTEPLLFVLRNQLGQQGPKFGCGVAQCGACTVLVNGAIVRSCVVQLQNVADGAQVTTLDGLGTAAAPHPLQRAFIQEQAGQCAFCINGMIVGALGWLQGRFAAGNRAVPSEDEIKQFLSGKLPGSTFVYLCRCGTHLRIVRAIQRAAKEMA